MLNQRLKRTRSWTSVRMSTPIFVMLNSDA